LNVTLVSMSLSQIGQQPIGDPQAYDGLQTLEGSRA
jgi:hypothetical protein